MNIALVAHDAPRTGAALFADALREALNAIAPVGCYTAWDGSRPQYVVANSLAALAGLTSCDAVIVHEHPWWLMTRPAVVERLRMLRPVVFTVCQSAGSLIRGVADLDVRPVPRRTMRSDVDPSPMGGMTTGEPVLRLLGSGTVSLTKGVDSWLQVVGVLRTHTAVSARWIGAVPDTRYATEMLADVERLGLSACVSFEELVEDVEPFYLWADAFLVTSRFEAYCRSIDEARAYGTAVFAFAGAFDAERVRTCDAVWVDRFSVAGMVRAVRQAHSAGPGVGLGLRHDRLHDRTDFAELAQAILHAAQGWSQ